MCEQVLDGNWLPILRAVLDVETDVILDVQFAVLLQDEDGHGGKLFGNRANTKHSLCGIGRVCIFICQAIPFAEDGPVLCDQYRTAQLPAICQVIEIALYFSSIRQWFWSGGRSSLVGIGSTGQYTTSSEHDEQHKREPIMKVFPGTLHIYLLKPVRGLIAKSISDMSQGYQYIVQMARANIADCQYMSNALPYLKG